MVPLVVMMAWFGVYPSWPIVLLPVVLALCVAMALGLGTIISSLSIENRDWERALGFVLSLGMWLSPVIYAPTMIPARLRDLYHLNPMVGILLGFRAALFNGFPIPVWELAYSAIWALVILIFGIWAFRRRKDIAAWFASRRASMSERTLRRVREAGRARPAG